MHMLKILIFILSIICDCGESKFFGLPCRHELALCVMYFKDPDVLNFEKRWEIKYFNFEEVQLSEEEKSQLELEIPEKKKRGPGRIAKSESNNNQESQKNKSSKKRKASKSQGERKNVKAVRLTPNNSNQN